MNYILLFSALALSLSYWIDFLISILWSNPIRNDHLSLWLGFRALFFYSIFLWMASL